MPRSGTSWLSQIFDSHPDVAFRLAPLFAYRFKDQVNAESDEDAWRAFFNQVYLASDDEFINQLDKRRLGHYPVFLDKEIAPSFMVIKDTRYHNLTVSILERFSDIRFIHIIRNPCAAINSWLKAPREFPQELDPLEHWRNGACRKTSEEEFWGFDDWIQVSKLYLDLQYRFPRQVKVIRYEDLVEMPDRVVKEMFDFVGLDLPDQTLDFLKISQASNVENEYAVFKNKKQVLNRWKTELYPVIINEIQSTLQDSVLYQFVK